MKEWSPVSDTWLNIMVAVVISLLVNVISDFTWHFLPLMKVILLILSSSLIGSYVHLKGIAIDEYHKSIEEKELFGPTNTLARKKERDEIFVEFKFKARMIWIVFIVFILSSIVLFGIQALQKGGFFCESNPTKHEFMNYFEYCNYIQAFDEHIILSNKKPVTVLKTTICPNDFNQLNPYQISSTWANSKE